MHICCGSILFLFQILVSISLFYSNYCMYHMGFETKENKILIKAKIEPKYMQHVTVSGYAKMKVCIFFSVLGSLERNKWIYR